MNYRMSIFVEQNQTPDAHIHRWKKYIIAYVDIHNDKKLKNNKVLDIDMHRTNQGTRCRHSEEKKTWGWG